MTKIVHININTIRSNKKHGTKDPPIRVQYKSKETEYGSEVLILGPCKIVYRPDKPLSCGAKVWIETEANVEVA